MFINTLMNINVLNQFMIDHLSPHPIARWIGFSIILFLYLLKVIITGSHHLITYCAGVYLFHGFILFATPKDENIPDPFELDKYEPEEEADVPSEIGNSFKPFIRNLPEYSYWLFCIKVLLISFALTFTSFTNIPVCTPILLIYFIFMVIATLTKLWKHANRYSYNPFWQSSNVIKE